MKLKYLYITLAIVFIIVLFIVINYYRGGKKLLSNPLRIKKPVRSILFIGDSNTVAPFSYADQLKKLYPGIVIKKIAQNGAKTDWALPQLRDELARNKYDAVAILLGSNDIYATGKTDQAKANLNQMYLLAKANGADVMAVTPPNKDYYVNKTEAKQQLLHDLVNWIGNNPNKDYFFNFWDITKDKSLFSSSDGYQHPQARAHQILASQITQKIKV